MMTGRDDARTLVRRVLDAGSWSSWDGPVAELPSAPAAAPGSRYARELAAARERTGYDESIITGQGRLAGRRIAVVVSEYSFFAGSIGVAAAERLVRAVERATRERLPLLAAPSSGGVRIQEGVIAFVQMARICAAVMRHRAAGLPFLTYLRHPTTGGVFASFGSLGQITAAEPGALIGFLGPRVYEALHGEPFPHGVQTAENLRAHGVIDAVVSNEEIGAVAARALAVLCAPRHVTRHGSPAPARERTHPGPVPTRIGVSAWDSVQRTRRADRPGVRELLRQCAREVTVLSGTGGGETCPGLLLALALFGGVPCMLIGQDRRGQRMGGPLDPAGLRMAGRGMRLAAELRLPVVSVVDTPGAALSAGAEEHALAGEIARCLTKLITLPVATVSLLLGEGTGGAALALLPADRVICAEHAWLSPLSPEGASVIVHRTADHAGQMAGAQGIRSRDLLRTGIVDRIVDERPDAADEPREFCARAAEVLRAELTGLLDWSDAERLSARDGRLRALGGRP